MVTGGDMLSTDKCCDVKQLSYSDRLHQQLAYYKQKVSDIESLLVVIESDKKFNEFIEAIEKVGLYI